MFASARRVFITLVEFYRELTRKEFREIWNELEAVLAAHVVRTENGENLGGKLTTKIVFVA